MKLSHIHLLAILRVPILEAAYFVPIIGAMRKSVFTPEYDLLRTELRKRRSDAALSQRDLAGRLGVPHSWVAKVESGERRIDLIEFCWFLAACGLDPLPSLTRLARQIRPTRARRSTKEAR